MSKAISVNTELASVSFEADYLFGRCIPHLDRDGRMPGHPAIVKSLACPLRNEINSGSVPELLRTLSGVGLVKWYDVDGKQVLEFPGFSRNQKGMKYKREAESRFPPSTSENAQDLCRITAGPTPDKVRVSQVKSSQVKSSEVKLSDGADAPADDFADMMGLIREVWDPNREDQVTNGSILKALLRKGKLSVEFEAAVRGLPLILPDSRRPSMKWLYAKGCATDMFKKSVDAHYEREKGPPRHRDGEGQGPQHISAALDQIGVAR